MSRSKRDTDFRTKGSSKRAVSLVSNIGLYEDVLASFKQTKKNFVGNLINSTVCTSRIRFFFLLPDPKKKRREG
jgi:hypothetical protein